jgi:GNAT superfamily N-acetyltransferase
LSEVRVREISLPRDRLTFIKTWWRAHRGDPQWVPPLIAERKAFLDPRKNPYFTTAEVQCFIASVAGEDVGTLAVTVDRPYQARDPGMGFFGFFEFIDDEAVARALFEAGCAWLRARGMDRAMGPLSFNTNHEFGLLVEGFDTGPFIANPHNAAYFAAIYEKLGLESNMDWYAYWIDAGAAVESRINKVAERFVSRHPEMTLRCFDVSKWDREVGILHEIYDDAWEENWGHVQVSTEEFRFIADGFKAVVDPTLCYVVELEGKPVAVSITLPNLNLVLKKMNGRLFPFGWRHLAFGRKSIDELRVFMLGVKQEFQKLPLGAILYQKTWARALEMGVRGGEASLILQNNAAMNGALERMGRVYKTYRTYETRL